MDPGFRFHDLRHTCAALAIAQGAHPKAVQERLGHASIRLTLDTYGHLLPGLDERLCDDLEEAHFEALAACTRPANGGRCRGATTLIGAETEGVDVDHLSSFA